MSAFVAWPVLCCCLAVEGFGDVGVGFVVTFVGLVGVTCGAVVVAAYSIVMSFVLMDPCVPEP